MYSIGKECHTTTPQENDDLHDRSNRQRCQCDPNGANTFFTPRYRDGGHHYHGYDYDRIRYRGGGHGAERVDAHGRADVDGNDHDHARHGYGRMYEPGQPHVDGDERDR